MDSALSNLLLIDECLLDKKRVGRFECAINETVKPGDIVVDAGTGTGIMALLAAKAGAKKVFALERDIEITKIAQKNFKANNYRGIIETVNIDVRDFHLPKGVSVDVLIMEMLDTGLIAELQASALIELKKNSVISEKTILLPNRAKSFIFLINYDFDFYGFTLPLIVQARGGGTLSRIQGVFSDKYCYSDIDFKNITSEKLSIDIKLQVAKAGTVNAVELTTDIQLDKKWCKYTTDMNMPVIIPISPRQVKKGDIIKIKMGYVMGQGFGDFKISSLL